MQFVLKQVMSEEQVAAYRAETPGCKSRVHLNNAGAALMPQPVVEAIQNHIQLESEVGGYEAATIRAKEIEEFYSVGAMLLGCCPRNLAFTANATDAYSRALSSIPFKTGDAIVTTAEDYVSNQITFLSLSKRLGVKIVRAKSNWFGGVDLDDFEKKIKEHQPRLVAVTHVPSASGLVQPVGEIGAIVSRYDTLYLLDACQSVGQWGLDIKNLKCDFLSTTSRKFLRGPRGAGFLFVSDKALESGLEPLFIDTRGAEWIQEDVYVHHKEAARFEDWEFAYALMLGTTAAIKYAQKVGLESIRIRLHELSEYLRTKLADVPCVKVLDKGERKCAIITIQVSDKDVVELKKYLFKLGINVTTTFRSSAVIDFDSKKVKEVIRLSPHYYNTFDEIDAVISRLRHVVES